MGAPEHSPYLDRPLRTLREVAAKRLEAALVAQSRFGEALGLHGPDIERAPVRCARAAAVAAWKSWEDADREARAAQSTVRAA